MVSPIASNSDRVTHAYDELRGLIVWGRLAPGTRIIETEIAERLGVSRTPVRSALQRLQQEGYIISQEGGKQLRQSVAPLTHEDAQELFAIVGEVEALAARSATGLDSAAREKLAEELASIDRQLLEAAGSIPPDTQTVFDLYTRFHRRYVEAGAGPRLLGLHDAVKPQADRYRRLYSSALVARVPLSVKEHGVIIRAIRKGDADAAQRAVQTNWRNAAERLGRVIIALGERGSW